MRVGHADELDQEPEQPVEEQEQTRHGHVRPRPGREPPKDREQYKALEYRFVELGRVQHLAVDDKTPRHVGRFAPELAVDEVTDAPEAEP